MSVGAVLATLVAALVMVAVVGLFVWAARADGRDQRQFDGALRDWLRRHGRTR